MALQEQTTTRRLFARYFSAMVVFCTFLMLMPPGVATLTSVNAAENERPYEEDEETCESKLSVSTSIRRRGQGNPRPLQSSPIAATYAKLNSYANPISAVDGHQLANGLAAPLII